MTTQINQQRKGQAGNVLFLILIAVALFAALSYAVTQSTRSGGGDASSEKSLVSSAALTQYPASIKTAITRMIISSGVDVNYLLFNKPTDFAVLDDTTVIRAKKNAVFHPDPGGGATYTKAPSDVITTPGTGDWIINANNEVGNIGTTSGSAAATKPTADVIAFLPNVSKAVCDKIHAQLGMKAVNTATLAPSLTLMETSTGSVANGNILLATGIKILGTTPDFELTGQPQGCFNTSGNGYVYYHVLVER